ncbi:MAG: ATP-binding protein [Acidobacteriota bacterium]
MIRIFGGPERPAWFQSSMTSSQNQIEVSLRSKLDYVDMIESISDSVTRMMGFDEDAAHWIGMSVRESVVNAIVHGNKEDKGKHFGVKYEIHPDRLVVVVRDEGRGFDESRLPDPLDASNLLKPSGRGIFYMKSFMDEVEFNAIPGGGMELRMVKKLVVGAEGGDNEN